MSKLIKDLRDWAYYYSSNPTAEEDMTKAADLIEQQQLKISGLAATVERLRDALELYVELDAEVEAAEGEGVNVAKEVLESTPRQNLNAVKREAFREGFMISGEGFNGQLYEDGWRRVVKQFKAELNQRYPDKE